MMKFAYLTLTLAIAVALLAPDTPSAPPVSPAVTAPAASAPPVYGTSTTPVPASGITLQRSPDGHFYADATVNGAPVRFIVDTGATTVALSKSDAQRAGIAFTDTDFTGTARGAGGPVRFKPVVLDRIAIGPVEARTVDAAIVAGDLNVSLLGQSYLKRFANVQITGDTMVLD